MVIFFYWRSKERTIITPFFRHIGRTTAKTYRGTLYFFQYIGLLTHKLLFSSTSIEVRATLIQSLNAGNRLVIPLILAAALIGFSLTYSINYLLAQYNLQHRVILIAQNILMRDVMPFLISFVLCVSSGLMLIEAHHPSLHRTPEVVMSKITIPLILGAMFTAALLYIYIAVTLHVTIIFTVYYFIEGNIISYLMNFGTFINKESLLISLVNTMIYASLASLVAGFYYFEVSIRGLSMQKAVSRIITRGLFWLIGVSVFIKYFFPST